MTKAATAASAADEPIANMSSTRVSLSIAHHPSSKRLKKQTPEGDAGVCNGWGVNSPYLLPARAVLAKSVMYCCSLP
jgi:hypothetical protein